MVQQLSHSLFILSHRMTLHPELRKVFDDWVLEHGKKLNVVDQGKRN